MSDDAGAQKLAVMIVSMLAFATIGVIFSVSVSTFYVQHKSDSV